MALKDAFSVLFGIVCPMDAPVEAHMDFSGGAIRWNVSFSRTAQDWKVDAFASFYMMLIFIKSKI
jgi:hypothetical protein